MSEKIVFLIKRIDGDYVVLVGQDGTENRLARALLPEEADEGDKVLWENYAYALLKG